MNNTDVFKNLTECLNELKLLRICINEITLQMNDRPEIDKKFNSLYKERKEYLDEQQELIKKINLLINNY